MIKETRPHCVRYKPRRWILGLALVVCAAGGVAGWWALRGSSRLSDPTDKPHITGWLEQARAELDAISDVATLEQARRMYVSAAVICGYYRSAEQAIDEWYGHQKRQAWEIAARNCLAAARLEQAEVAIRQIRNQQVNRQLRREMQDAREKLRQREQQADASAGPDEDNRRLRWVQGAAMHGDFDTASAIARTITDSHVKNRAQLQIQTIRLASRDPDQQPQDVVENPDVLTLMYLPWLVRNGQSERAWQIASEAESAIEQLKRETWILKALQPPAAVETGLVWQRVQQVSPASSQQWIDLRMVTEGLIQAYLRLDDPQAVEEVLRFYEGLADGPHAPAGLDDPLSDWKIQARLDLQQTGKLAEEIAAAELSDQRLGYVVERLSLAAPELVAPAVAKSDEPFQRFRMLLGSALRRCRLE